MDMPKRVFLSSVFQSLAPVRKALHDRLIELGYDVWWAEDFPELRTLPAELVRAVCLQGEESDIYLGVFPSRYGSDPLGLAFTELEYHHAVSLGRPRFLYVLGDRRFVTVDQKAKQAAFLHLVRDRHLSPIKPTRVNSISELISRVSADFENLYRLPLLPSVPPWQAPCVERIVSSAAAIAAPSGLPDLSPWDAARFLYDVANRSFQEARVLGLAFLQRFFSSQSWTDRSFLRGLDEFLNAWTYVSAWTGVRGPLGQTSISKARIVLSQMLNDYSRVYDLAGAVASGLYSDRRLAAARKWYEVARRSQPLPGLLGFIALAEGNVEKAKLCFEDMLFRQNMDIDSWANYVSAYGFCLVRQGKQREGLRHYEEVLKDRHRLRNTTLARIYRRTAEAYRYISDINAALEFNNLAASVAWDSGLKDQWRKALKQRRQITSNKGMHTDRLHASRSGGR
jgi:tetratricopeptide (TPR) repeat protein